MTQHKISADKIITVPLQGAAEALKPIIYKEGGWLYCFLGSNADMGIVGTGHSVTTAIADWNKNLAEHLSKADASDPILQYTKKVLDELNNSNNEADVIKSAEAMSDIQLHIASIKNPELAEKVRGFYDQLKK